MAHLHVEDEVKEALAGTEALHVNQEVCVSRTGIVRHSGCHGDGAAQVLAGAGSAMHCWARGRGERWLVGC